METKEMSYVRRGRDYLSKDLSYLIRIGVGVIIVELGIILMQSLEFDIFGLLAKNFKRYRELVGLVWPIFLVMANASFIATITLVLEKMGTLDLKNENLPLKILAYTEATGPLFGLLQTFYNLAVSQLSLDTSLEQAELLSILTKQQGQAYGSTICGLVLAIFAYTVKTIFEARRGGIED